MSSPIQFSLTAAQCQVLRRLAEGKASQAERPLRQLAIKGLVTNNGGWVLTPAGEAAALMLNRLNEASPVSGGPGGGSEDGELAQKASHEAGLGIHAVSAPARDNHAPSADRPALGINARSSDVSGNKSQGIKERTRPHLSRLALNLLNRGDCLPETKRDPGVVCELDRDDWDLVVAHEARANVLTAAQRTGASGVRSLLRKLRRRPLPVGTDRHRDE